jgi:sulfite exporter TauE/SafE
VERPDPHRSLGAACGGISSRANRLLPVSSLPRALLLGALWGWLPCGLVYSTLLWAASQGNALDSAR